MDFLIRSIENGLELQFNNIKVVLRTDIDNCFSKEEILRLLGNDKITYSSMYSVWSDMPFSHIDNMPLGECLQRNLSALEKISNSPDLKPLYFKDVYEVYLRKV